MLNKVGIDTIDIFEISIVFMNFIIFFCTLDVVSIRKISNIKLLQYIGILICILVVVSVSDIFRNFRILLYIIFGIIYYNLVYDEFLVKCVIVTILFWISVMVVETASIGAIAAINNIPDINYLINQKKYVIQAIILSKVLLLIEFVLLRYFKLALEFKPKDMALIGLSISYNILSLLLVFGYNFLNRILIKLNIVFLILITMLLMLSTISLLVVIARIRRSDRLKLETELINERTQMNYKNYENIYEVHSSLRHVYHDLKNHMMCIKNYNSKEDIIKYIDNLSFEIRMFDSISHTGNETLDIILSQKIHECNKYNIKFESNINFSKLGFVSNIDVCSIFGNALDNSIEACKLIDCGIDKKIEVKVTYIKQFCIIKIINTKQNKINLTKKGIQTSKYNKYEHGIGLASIKRTVDKYDGEVAVNFSETEFILKIMIPIRS